MGTKIKNRHIFKDEKFNSKSLTIPWHPVKKNYTMAAQLFGLVLYNVPYVPYTWYKLFQTKTK